MGNNGQSPNDPEQNTGQGIQDQQATQVRQRDPMQQDVLETLRAQHDERERWRMQQLRTQQEQDHQRQMSRIQEALRCTRLRKGKKSSNRSKSRLCDFGHK